MEIGYEEGHVHFLVQSVPTNSVDEIIRVVKSITAREIFISFYLQLFYFHSNQRARMMLRILQIILMM